MREAPERVLVLRFSSAGDVLLTTPAVEALKKAWPTSEIIWAIKGTFEPLIRNNPFVDEVVSIADGESLMSFYRRLRALDAPVVLDLHDKVRSMLLRWMLPGESHVWQKRDRGGQVTVRLALRPYHASMPISTRMHQAVERLVEAELPPGHLRVYLTDEEQAEADAVLESRNLDLSKPILGMSAGANWETKRWPSDRFADLAERAHTAGMQILLTGSADERPLADQIIERVPTAVSLVGETSFTLLGGVINRCQAFVANDSGPMHVARGLGIPTLMFFGSTDPKNFTPDGHHVMFQNLSCSPCHFYGRNFCPRGHFKCMRDIDSDSAWTQLQPLLDGERRAFNNA